MKILHLSTSDGGSGAARGAYFLHNALQKADIESMMLVAKKKSHDVSVLRAGQEKNQKFSKFRSMLDQFPLRFYTNQNIAYSTCALHWLPNNVSNQIKAIDPDIINLHWICRGFLSPEDFKDFHKPIVWTLRDMWAFTGGCHYSQNCDKYTEKCGSCPQLMSDKENDISRKLWQRKLSAWQDLNFTLVAVSHWLAECASQSSLFKNRKISVIPNAINASKFKPIPKKVVRNILGLNENNKIILFGAFQALEDKRKGFHYLVPALQKIAQDGLGENTELLVFGASEPEKSPNVGMPITYMGQLHDDITISLVYAAADVTVVPSIQDAFPKTTIESLACGTPVVCFDSTGLRDVIEHEKNGYRAKCFSVDDLANGIAWVIQDDQRWQSLSYRAREKVEQEFTLEIQAQAYLKLYQEVLQSHKV